MARERRRPVSPETAIAGGITRRATPVQGTPAEQLAVLESKYGRAGARERLGISERTARRWRAGSKPTAANAEQLSRQARLASRRGSRGEKRLRTKGAKIRMTGNLGPPQREYKRHRTVNVTLTPEQTGDILDNWLAGDDAAAVDALRDALGDRYLANFDFEDLTQLEFRDPDAD